MNAAQEIFRTDAVSRAQRLTYWNDVAAMTFGDIEVASGVRDFSAQLQRRRLGELTVATVASAPARVSGGRSAHQHDWFLLLNERGQCRIEQCGREVVLLPGELTALRASEDYHLDFSAPNETIVLRMPAAGKSIDVDNHVAMRHAAHESQLLAAFMRRLATLRDQSLTRNCHALARTALDLVALSWPASTTRSSRQSMSQWEARVRDVVTRNLSQPGLDATFIADELAISTRFVHLIFQQMGHSASAFTLELRLEMARTLLRDNPHLLILDVALNTGFNDLSAFSRAFRRRYGCSPRAWRESHRK